MRYHDVSRNSGPAGHRTPTVWRSNHASQMHASRNCRFYHQARITTRDEVGRYSSMCVAKLGAPFFTRPNYSGVPWRALVTGDGIEPSNPINVFSKPAPDAPIAIASTYAHIVAYLIRAIMRHLRSFIHWRADRARPSEWIIPGRLASVNI